MLGKQFYRSFCNLNQNSKDKLIIVNWLNKLNNNNEDNNNKNIKDICYTLKWKDIKEEKEIRNICRKYNNSFIKTLINILPELNLLPWKFTSVPNNYWKDKENQKQFLEWFKEKYKIESINDWKSSKIRKNIILNGGRGLIKDQYNENLPKLLKTNYPHEEWNKIFKEKGYWNNQINVRNEFKNIEKELNILETKDWLHIKVRTLYNYGFSYPLTHIYKSYHSMLVFAFPELENEINVLKSSKINWEDIDILNNFIEKLKNKYNIISNEQWYLITRKQIIEEGGKGMLNFYGGLINVLSIIYPNDKWIPHPYNKNYPIGFWKDQNNVNIFMNSIKEKYNIETKENWYDYVSYQTFLKEGAATGILYYNGIIGLLKCAYPNEEWKEIKKPHGHWKNKDNIIKLIKYIENKLSIKNPEDWYRISKEIIYKFGGIGALKNYDIIEMLKLAYPLMEWNEEKLLRRNKKASQFLLKQYIEELYPNYKLKEDYRPSNIKFSTTQMSIELDIYIKELKLAFEYNGEQHYHDFPVYGPLELYKKRDLEKEIKCKENNIKLIIIPYWWDKEKQSLIEIIKKISPKHYKYTNDYNVNKLIKE